MSHLYNLSYPLGKMVLCAEKESFIKELWPAQHLHWKPVFSKANHYRSNAHQCGQNKGYRTDSSSAFLADRASLAIIIAPFRALCHEIKNTLIEAFHDESTKVDELSDALQTDFEISESLGQQQILVVTPEKLLYSSARAGIGNAYWTIDFDEGHQFDSGTRGITYELLLTSLRSMIPEKSKILISAVIQQCGGRRKVAEWGA